MVYVKSWFLDKVNSFYRSLWIKIWRQLFCSPVSHGLPDFWCEVEEIIAEEIHASSGFAMVFGNSPPHSGSLPPFVTLCTHM
ncbi:hypothetical protein Hanom_Chr15g01344681 [Helianthus anomalus]